MTLDALEEFFGDLECHGSAFFSHLNAAFLIFHHVVIVLDEVGDVLAGGLAQPFPFFADPLMQVDGDLSAQIFGGCHSRIPGNVKTCAVGKHPKSEKHGNTAQFSEVERSGTQENCGGIGSGCRLRLRPLPVLHRRQSQWVARIDPNAVVVDKNIAENDRFDLFSR